MPSTLSHTCTRALLVSALLASLPLLPCLPQAGAAPAQLPTCQQEDGNVDGQPCTWVDPGTGRSFYVNSDNYR